MGKTGLSNCSTVFPTYRGVALFALTILLLVYYIVRAETVTFALGLFTSLWLLSSYTLVAVYRNILLEKKINVVRSTKTQAIAGQQLPVEIIVRNSSPLPLYSVVIVDYPPYYYTEGEPIVVETSAPAHNTSTLEYRVTTRIGYHEFGDMDVFFCDLLKIFCTKCKYKMAHGVEAFPKLARTRVHMLAEMKILSGITASRKRGMGTTFYGVREYVPGDEIRFIDWKHTAKMFPTKLFIKEFEHESMRNFIVIVALSNRSFIGKWGECPAEQILLRVANILSSLSRGPERLGFALAAPGYYSSTRFTRGEVFRKELLAVLSRLEWPEPQIVYSIKAGFIPPSLSMLVKQRIPLVLGKTKAWFVLVYHITGFEDVRRTSERIAEAYYLLLSKGHHMSPLLVYGMPALNANSVSKSVAEMILKDLRQRGIKAILVPIEALDEALASIMV